MLYGVPPYAPTPKPPGEQALTDLRRAIQEECQQNAVLYLAESKKLCMAVSEAYTLKGEYERRGLQPPDLLRQELQHQLLAYALMRLLPEEAVKAALERAGARSEAALNLNPPMSRVAVLVGELEGGAPADLHEDKVAEALAAQPMFRVMGQAADAVDVLATHFAEVAPKATQLVLGNQEAILAAMQLNRPRL